MSLKKYVLVTILALACTAGFNLNIAQAQNRPRVAVLDFDYATVQTTSAAIFGTNIDVGKGITDLLITNLVKDGSFSVIERQAIDKLLAEQNFANSDRADPSTAARIGKMAGVHYIVIGAITEFGNETKKTNLGGMGGNWHGFGAGGVGHSNSKANVAINARIVNVETGEIVAVAEGSGQSSRSSTSLLGGGGNWHGFGAGKADFGSSDFQQTIIGEATKAAVEKLTADLVANSSKVSAAPIQIDGMVASVDNGQVVLNVGAKAGIKVGDQLEVLRVGKEIKDPVSGQVIRRLTTTIGVVRATDVDDVSAVCTVVSGTGFKTGDHIRNKAQ
jgi:curli biogenesis system outer membrane secretion channel CsgG